MTKKFAFVQVEVFLEDDLNVFQNNKFVFHRVENIVGKRKCWLPHYFYIQQNYATTYLFSICTIYMKVVCGKYQIYNQRKISELSNIFIMKILEN